MREKMEKKRERREKEEEREKEKERENEMEGQKGGIYKFLNLFIFLNFEFLIFFVLFWG